MVSQPLNPSKNSSRRLSWLLLCQEDQSHFSRHNQNLINQSKNKKKLEVLLITYSSWQNKRIKKRLKVEETWCPLLLCFDNKAGYAANTSRGRVGRGGNACFPTFQLERDGPTDRRTDRPTDGRTDKASYRVASLRLKSMCPRNFYSVSKDHILGIYVYVMEAYTI